MALDGVIFDFDGVLVDSNDAHIRAWQQAFQRFGYNVEPDRIFVEVGKGGDKLVADILGQRAEDTRGEELRAANKQVLFAIWQAEGLRVFRGRPGAAGRPARARNCGRRWRSSSNDQQIEKAEAASARRVAKAVRRGDHGQRRQRDEAVAGPGARGRAQAGDVARPVRDDWRHALGRTRGDGCRRRCIGRDRRRQPARGAAGRRRARRLPRRRRDRAELDAALRAASPGAAHLDARDAGPACCSAARNAAGGKPAGSIVADGNADVIAAFGGACDGGDLAHPAIECLRVAGRAAGRAGGGNDPGRHPRTLPHVRRRRRRGRDRPAPVRARPPPRTTARGGCCRRAGPAGCCRGL